MSQKKPRNKQLRIAKNPRICNVCGFTVRGKNHDQGAHHQLSNGPGRHTPSKY